MEEITTQLGATESSESWFNVANSCREAMKSFTTELSRIHEFSLDPDTKAGDVKAILKAFIREEYSTGRYVDTLLSFVESVWDHLQSLLHRKSTTRDDATRVFVWTYMLMLELNNLLVQRHRMHALLLYSNGAFNLLERVEYHLVLIERTDQSYLLTLCSRLDNTVGCNLSMSTNVDSR